MNLDQSNAFMIRNDGEIFNVADIYVTLSAFALIIVVLIIYRESDFEVIFPPKKKSYAKE